MFIVEATQSMVFLLEQPKLTKVQNYIYVYINLIIFPLFQAMRSKTVSI